MLSRILLAAATIAVAACSANAQEGDVDRTPSQRSFNLAGFNSVSVAGPHNVVVQVGPAHSVRAEGPAGVLDRLEIVVEDGGNLEVRQKKDAMRIRWGRDLPATTVYVTLPALRAASIAGSGDMRIDRVEGGDFAASIAGSGDMDVGALRVEAASFSIAGSGNVTAAGNAARSKISIAGSGDVKLDRLESRTASVSIVGSGGVNARATETADVSIMGSGDVVIGGGAKCSVSKMGSGSVRCQA